MATRVVNTLYWYCLEFGEAFREVRRLQAEAKLRYPGLMASE